MPVFGMSPKYYKVKSNQTGCDCKHIKFDDDDDDDDDDDGKSH